MRACLLAVPIATHLDLPGFLTFANIRSLFAFPATEVAGKFGNGRAIPIVCVINPGKASFTVTTLLKNIIGPRRRTNDTGILCKNADTLNNQPDQWIAKANKHDCF